MGHLGQRIFFPHGTSKIHSESEHFFPPSIKLINYRLRGISFNFLYYQESQSQELPIGGMLNLICHGGGGAMPWNERSPQDKADRLSRTNGWSLRDPQDAVELMPFYFALRLSTSILESPSGPGWSETEFKPEVYVGSAYVWQAVWCLKVTLP